MSEDGLYLFNSTSTCNLCCVISIMHLSRLCRQGGSVWGGDLIVFVGPGVGHLTDLVLPGEGIFESWRYLTANSDEKDWDQTYVSRFYASCMRRTVWKSWQWEQAKPECISPFCLHISFVFHLLLCLSWVLPWIFDSNVLHGEAMICPWAGNLTAKFWKMSNPHPMPCLPPAAFTLIGAYISTVLLETSSGRSLRKSKIIGDWGSSLEER